MRIDAIPIGDNPPEDVNVIIEVPVGGEPIKYEMDKEAGTLFVDRFLHTPMRYPGNYGFVPHTLSGDGDPIDVLVCNTRELVPGCVINVRPIGVLIMEDNAGQDEKVIAVPTPKLTKRYENVQQLHRPAADHPRSGRALLRALQGSGARQMGQDRRLARRRRAKKMIVEAIERAKAERPQCRSCLNRYRYRRWWFPQRPSCWLRRPMLRQSELLRFSTSYPPRACSLRAIVDYDSDLATRDCRMAASPSSRPDAHGLQPRGSAGDDRRRSWRVRPAQSGDQALERRVGGALSGTARTRARTCAAPSAVVSTPSSASRDDFGVSRTKRSAPSARRR
jgi:inorganic pyrophosphatase